MASIVTAEWVQDEARRVWDSFEPWRADLGELRAVMSVRPVGYSARSRISGASATRLEMAQAVFTEFCSGKLPRMVDNFVGRMLNGDFKIESRDVSDDRAEQARVEALLHVADGWLGMLDSQVRRGRMGSSWRYQVANTFAYPGSGVAFPLVHRDPVTNAGTVTCEMLDPLAVAYTFGNETPDVIVVNQRMGAQTARAHLAANLSPVDDTPYQFPEGLRLEKDTDPVDLMTVWVLEDGEKGKELRRACLVNGIAAGVQRTPFDRQVVQIGNIHTPTSTYQTYPGGAGGRSRGVEDAFVREHAQPFIYSLKRIHENFNTIVSAAYAGIAQGLDPALHITSRTGLSVPEEQLDAGGRVESKRDDELEISVVNQGVSQIIQGLDALMKTIEKEYNEVMNPSLFGGYTPGQSGFSQVQQTSHSQTVFRETAQGCMGLALDVFRELLLQFRQDDLVEFRFDGGGSQTIPERIYRSSDLPERPVLGVEWQPDLGDGMQQIAAAQQMYALGLPLSFALSRGMNIQNPQELMERRAQEDLRQHPLVQQANVVQFFLEKWLEAADRARRARSTPSRQAHEAAARFYRNQYAMAEMALGAPQLGQGTPAKPPGYDNRILPPPLSGQDPVGEAAMMGRPAVGMGGQGGAGGA